MTLVALTGGIASGKSTVAAMLQKRGAVCIDADDVAREVVEPGTPALAEIEREFGSHVVREGRLDRAALAEIVFSDAAARERLNGIVHPRVQSRTAELIEWARKENPGAVIVYVIPLFVETSNPQKFDAVVAVSASPQTRIDRLVSHRGMSTKEASQRVSAQASEEERLAIADYVVSTEGSLSETEAEVSELWAKLSSA